MQHGIHGLGQFYTYLGHNFYLAICLDIFVAMAPKLNTKTGFAIVPMLRCAKDE